MRLSDDFLTAPQDGAPKVSIDNTFDASWQANHLNNWQQAYDQISHGPFKGQLKQVNLSQLDISREFSSQSLRQECYVKRGGFWLGFSQGPFNSKLNGVTANNKSFLWHSGQQDFELITEKNTVIYSVLLEASLLPDEIKIQQKVAQLPTEKIHAFLYLLNRLLNPDNPYWLATSQQKIITDAVQDILEQAQTQSTGKPSFHKRAQVITQVRDYITHAPSHVPVTITELCQHAHVSRRTLQNAFQDILGISAKQFIKAVRLNQIRRALLSVDEHRPIYQIAFDFGYFHLGQFTQDYKIMFAETASQTRLKAAQLK